MNTYKQDFIEIATSSTDKYTNDAYLHLINVIKNFQAVENLTSFFVAVELLSERPNYGDAGGAGGVNVDHQEGVSYTLSDESTWVNLEVLVDLVKSGGGTPNWWDDEWTTGSSDEELDAEKTICAKYEAATHKFISYFTGNPLVKVEMFYEPAILTMTRIMDGKEETLEITKTQCSELNQLSPDNQIQAGHIFCEAQMLNC